MSAATDHIGAQDEGRHKNCASWVIAGDSGPIAVSKPAPAGTVTTASDWPASLSFRSLTADFAAYAVQVRPAVQGLSNCIRLTSAPCTWPPSGP